MTGVEIPMRILFLTPHPDDIEFACGSTEIELVEKGHEVILACLTADEYGTSRNDFKGERISRIRRSEMREAAKVVGIHKLYWLGYIDGYSRFDREAVERIKKFILRIDPDVIFAPDPFYTVDSHVDHISIAKITLYIWNRLKKKPLYLMYYTHKPNYYIPVRYGKRAIEAFKKHISQGFSSPFATTFFRLVKFIFGFFTPHAVFPEIYRLVGVDRIKNYKNPVRVPFFLKIGSNRIVRRLFHRLLSGEDAAIRPSRELYLPTPKELGLKEFRFNIDD